MALTYTYWHYIPAPSALPQSHSGCCFGLWVFRGAWAVLQHHVCPARVCRGTSGRVASREKTVEGQRKHQPLREYEEWGNWSFFLLFPLSFFFQTLFDAFSFFIYINKMKAITGKMPTGLLKAVLMHWLEFSRNLGCPESTKSGTLDIH